MCGRVITKASVAELVTSFAVERRQGDVPRDLKARYNGAPGLDYPLIIREHDMPGATFMMARWGLVPRWVREARPKFRPINAASETIASNGMFRAAYRWRRAIMPIDGFFEWQAIRGARAKRPFAVAMKSGKPFALAAIWESRVDPETGLEQKTFAVVTCPANELMAEIHDRMPVILAPED
ncbi:MAG: response-associated peptidase [Xanthobacteraceae bacterium]|jgi:putative SOS response-associated peptidase YedK|nr:response-associated peptidase [Xanthobacteraceae bacterium]